MTVYVLRQGEGFRTGTPVGVFSTREAAEAPLFDLVKRESDRDMALYEESNTTTTQEEVLDDALDPDEEDWSEYTDPGDPWTDETSQGLLTALEGRDFEDLATRWYDFCGEAYVISEHDLDAALSLSIPPQT